MPSPFDERADFAAEGQPAADQPPFASEPALGGATGLMHAHSAPACLPYIPGMIDHHNWIACGVKHKDVQPKQVKHTTHLGTQCNLTLGDSLKAIQHGHSAVSRRWQHGKCLF